MTIRGDGALSLTGCILSARDAPPSPFPVDIGPGGKVYVTGDQTRKTSSDQKDPLRPGEGDALTSRVGSSSTMESFTMYGFTDWRTDEHWFKTAPFYL